MFITLYGINNVGKSTHARMLAHNLKKLGHEAIYMKYPVYDIAPSGELLNRVIRGREQDMTEEELQLWFVINRHQFQPTLKEYLEKGIIVVAEDYIGTALAWGAAKGADQKWLKDINKHLLEPDLNILINGQRSLHAVEAEHIHENDNELANKVRKNLLELADQQKWKKVELQERKQDTQKLILDIVKKYLS